MADDLASFIESQKRKLERERTEILHAQESEVTCKLIDAIYKLGISLLYWLSFSLKKFQLTKYTVVF